MSRHTPFICGLCLALMALSLGACQGIHDPSPMPRGYVFHKNDYKTIPGAPVDSIGVPYSLPGTAASAAHWRAAARDLTGRIAASGVLECKCPVSIMPQTPPGPFAAAFDHALRNALIERGHPLAEGDKGAMQIVYTVARSAKGSGAPKDAVEISLTVQGLCKSGEKPKALASEKGVYPVPGADSYDWRPGMPWTPVTWGR